MHRIEAVIEGNFDHIPEPDRPGWVFPGEIVNLQTTEKDSSFQDAHGEFLLFDENG